MQQSVEDGLSHQRLSLMHQAMQDGPAKMTGLTEELSVTTKTLLLRA